MRWILAIIVVSNVFAFDKIGTRVARFLKIDETPAKCAALPGDAAYMWYNPASATAENYSFAATYTGIQPGVVFGSFGLLITRKYLAFGVYALGYNSGKIEITTEERPEGTGLFYSIGGSALGFSIISKLSSWFTMGVSGKVITEYIYHESARTVALDAGGTAVLEDIGNLRVAAVITNLGGSMQLDGADLAVSDSISLITQSYRLPTRFKFGVAKPVGNGWLFGELFHDAALYEGVKAGFRWENRVFGVFGGISYTDFSTLEEIGIKLVPKLKNLKIEYSVINGHPTGLISNLKLVYSR